MATTTSEPDIVEVPEVRGLSSTQKKRFQNFFVHIILIITVIIMLFPALLVVSTSLKYEEEIESSDFHVIPEEATTDNYKYVLEQEFQERRVVDGKRVTETFNQFRRWVTNSLQVAVGTTIIGVSLAASTAYAFSRFQFLGRRPMLMAFLITQMFPGAILVVPLYNIFNENDLLNKLPGLVIAYCTLALPFSVWMLKGFFDAIPYDLEEAAIIDGATPVGAFLRIALPLTLPGIAVVAFFNFMTAWNEFMMALTFMTSEGKKTLPVGLRSYVFQFETDWHYLAAGSVMATVPVMIGFLWAQRYLIAGLTAGGVKG